MSWERPRRQRRKKSSERKSVQDAEYWNWSVLLGGSEAGVDVCLPACLFQASQVPCTHGSWKFPSLFFPLLTLLVMPEIAQ
uniref:Uncharacterized protein n=1 Tax=Triticum urartu TaxID=4572 RepID=A0A8R7UEC1_TRIUA